MTMKIEEKQNLFKANELQANKYCAMCLVYAAVLLVLMWICNILGIFIVDHTLMNVATVLGCVCLVTPAALVRFCHWEAWWVKYLLICGFLLGMGIMSSAITIHVVAAWACPILVSCHYYSPRHTTFTLLGVIFMLFVSMYIGLYFGVWDSNMMHSTASIQGFAERVAFINASALEGIYIHKRIFIFYFLPRAGICAIIYLTGKTLSNRTYRLLEQQQADYLERERLGAELSVATHIQESMLPSTFPAFPKLADKFDIYATMNPSKEVGGDFYDFFLIDSDHLALVMADVSGKGVPAAMYMMAAKTAIKSHAVPGQSPADILYSVNNQLLESEETELFVTVWLGIYELSTGQLTAANAGHEYPAMKSGTAPFALIKDKHGFVLGGMEDMEYTDYTLEIQPGDILYVYTDGVAEAQTLTDDQYGTQRMLDALNRNPGANLQTLLHGVKADVDAFAGEAPQFDDITMLAIQRKS